MRRSAIKTIAILSNTSWSVYNFRRGLIRRLSAEGYRVLIVAPPDQYTAQLQEEPCLFFPVTLSRHKVNPLHDFRYAFQVFSILKKYKPDLMISYTIKPNIYGQLAARMLGIPRLAVVTGLGYLFIAQNWKTRIVKTLYRHSFKRAERVWFLNKDDLAIFLSDGTITKAQAGYLPGEGVDINYFKPMPTTPVSERPLCFLYAGRLIKEKGVPEFVRAAQIIKSAHPGIQFKIAGFIEREAPGAIQLADIKAWEASGLITYKGPKEDIRPTLAEADCVVLPTYYREGVPRILLEAASMGIVIVGTNSPGSKDIVIEGENGFLCQEREPVQLAHTLTRIIQLPETERRKLGIRGRAIVAANFREEIIIDRYLRLLEQVLGCPADQRTKAPIKLH
ncbi:MAG: glycosyltransferase family 4 protein [Phaeodactylibacter sp.]|uniref:glycosyltransferase family 4 protein n=1 Tax=Phaeodactylibacter sp. TaxID=1940289 RepID=UPI0032ED2484